MKLFKKWYDICILAVCLLLFLILRIALGSSILLYVLIPIIGILAHLGITKFYDDQLAKEHSSFEYQFKVRKESNEQELSKYISRMRELAKKHSHFRNVVSAFEAKVEEFSKKEEALIDLIHLNGDSAKRFLLERSMDTNGFIIANAKKMIKTMIAYQAQSSVNRPSSIEEVKAIKDVKKSLKGLTVNYDQLLEEVSKMGDDFNPEDPGLKDVVENLQELRKRVDEEDDESSEEGEGVEIFVTPTKVPQGQTAGRRG